MLQGWLFGAVSSMLECVLMVLLKMVVVSVEWLVGV